MDSNLFVEQFEKIKQLAEEWKDDSIHICLTDIYLAGVEAQPQTIVELGVSKDALANKALSYVATMYDSQFISCDIEDYKNMCDYPKWRFVQSHDIDLARRFDLFCLEYDLDSFIDLLFIDTDERYDHVKQEIEAWFPFLSKNATVMFRCTNLQKRLHYPNGHEPCLGWDNERGVIRALEDYFECKFEETYEFTDIKKGWLIKHKPWGAGLTAMRRL